MNKHCSKLSAMDTIEPPHPQTSPKRKRIDISKKNEQTCPEQNAHAHHSQSTATRTTTTTTEADTELRECLVNAMTRAQQIQARACANLVVLTDKMHDWARDLNRQEHWLCEERRQLVEQQQALSARKLDVATGTLRLLKNRAAAPGEAGGAAELADDELVEQFKTVVAVLEGNIEVLVSELQVEKEARKAAEEKLRGKEGKVDEGWTSTPEP